MREQLGGTVGRQAPVERRVEVGDHHVVGLERLEAAGLQAPPALLEDDRRRGEADLPVADPRLALQLGRAARGAARLGEVGGVGLGDRRRVERGDHRVGVDALDAREHRAQRGVLVEQGRRVNQANASARCTANSRPGWASRVATIARQARPVAIRRARGAAANGIP